MENQSGDMDIQLACRVGDLELLKSTLQKYPELLNWTDRQLGWSPLYRTVICGHFEIAKYLLEEGADPNHVNKLGESALHQAADNNKVNVAKLLLKYGADPNLQQNGKK